MENRVAVSALNENSLHARFGSCFQVDGPVGNTQSAFRFEAFLEVPPEVEPPHPPRFDRARLKARRKSWARLIRRVYEVDQLLCPCGERMRVVGFIAQTPVILKILTHIG